MDWNEIDQGKILLCFCTRQSVEPVFCRTCSIACVFILVSGTLVMEAKVQYMFRVHVQYKVHVYLPDIEEQFYFMFTLYLQV